MHYFYISETDPAFNLATEEYLLKKEKPGSPI
jgi:hypothetical protein